MTQKTLAKRAGINAQYLCRIERGRLWPSKRVWEELSWAFYESGDWRHRGWPTIVSAQLRTWRAYDPIRKGKRP